MNAISHVLLHSRVTDSWQPVLIYCQTAPSRVLGSIRDDFGMINMPFRSKIATRTKLSYHFHKVYLLSLVIITFKGEIWAVLSVKFVDFWASWDLCQSDLIWRALIGWAFPIQNHESNLPITEPAFVTWAILHQTLPEGRRHLPWPCNTCMYQGSRPHGQMVPRVWQTFRADFSGESTAI
jgi:hypothetical protein